MENSTIILIVLFSICGLFLIWALKNGNNIKLKKKDKKKKDKFKDVVPKEKPETAEKPKKQKPDKIRQTVKDEKSGKIEPPTNKVVKVTKEDFKTNDIKIPKSFEEVKEQKKENKDDEFNIDDFDLEKEMEALGIKPPQFNGPPKFNDEFNDFDPTFPNPYSMNGPEEFNIKEFNGEQFSDDEFLLDKPMPEKPKEKGTFINETMEERFSKVFGDELLVQDKTAREVIIGDIMSGNRSRTNREARERRNKWLK